jgi:hypothetical protein
MAEISARNSDPTLHSRVSERTWAGDLVTTTHATHYLHLYAFPCDKCSGPVIVGSIGTRKTDLSKETAISGIGAICLACGCRPETLKEPSVGHCFRPAEWEWAVKGPVTCGREQTDAAPAERPAVPDGTAAKQS